ncbi:MAG: acyltransferase [Oscillospiraceae bacterium]|jgi:surface polysaccharide O-acyltransferase-like enzyme|nr:acyltransferase [Oscillospiraceae bacterium]
MSAAKGDQGLPLYLPARAARNSNPELLRILAMLLIVLYHSLLEEPYTLAVTAPSELRGSAVAMLIAFGRPANNVFLLLAGYYGVQTPFRPHRLWNLAGQTWFYAAALAVLSAAANRALPGFSDLLQLLSPLSQNRWWFITIYMGLMLFSPWLNRFLCSLEEGSLRRLCLLSFALFCLLPSVLLAVYGRITNPLGASYLTWFFALYCIGAYFRRFPPKGKASVQLRLALAWSAVLLLTTVLSVNFFGGVMDRLWYMHQPEYLPAFLSALHWVLYFIGRKPFTSRIINTVSGCTFGVYLLHTTVLEHLFPMTEHANGGGFYPYVLLAVFGTFALCAAADFLFWQQIGQRIWTALTGKAVQAVRKRRAPKPL